MLDIINIIFFYSILGFVLESVVYKVNNSPKYSSIFYGPYTLVYGFGMLGCLLIYNNLGQLTNNILLNYFIYYLIFFITTSVIEAIGGYVINYFLKIDQWDYSNHKFHFEKYLCLDFSIYWGILAMFFMFIIHPFIEMNILSNIPNYTTYIILFFFIIDLSIMIEKKIIKRKNLH